MKLHNVVAGSTAPEQYKELRSLYFSVADLEPRAQKSALDKACHDRPELRAKIEKLLLC